MMDLRQLRYFVTVVEEGQITAAARQLHMAQPPLSQQIQLLEKELGVDLFIREHRHMELTEAGKLLYERARQILNLSDSARREISDFKQGLKGTLHIGTVSSSGSVILSSAMRDFHQEHESVHFEIYDGNTFEVIDMLHKGLVEIGIVRTPFKAGSFHCKILNEEPMVAALPRELDWCPGRTHITLQELDQKPLIIYRRFDQLLHDTCISQDITPVLFCRNDDARTTILWANAGLGIAVTPASAVNLAAHDNLSVKIIDEPTLRTRIAAIWPKGRYLSSLGEIFIQTLQL